ncbi:luciferin 4-monooxygenase-like isoform X1 [Maniola hyperantus]|uniref:luciferin 4-monooxygenase-like isoform X1 n=1 Tax=Aphantopus hyperantus TaxID=2795564 RepID=UPI0021389E3B
MRSAFGASESNKSLTYISTTMSFKEYPPNYHFGHVAFERLSLYPDRVCQIDAATGAEESYESVLKRSVSLAKGLRAYGLTPGDVVAIGGLNHLDICIPHFAALFNGLPIVGVDPYFKYDEMRALFDITRPKIAFCQNESYDTYARAAADLKLDIKLVNFDEGECTMKKFIEMYEEPEHVEDFKVAEYDLDKVYPFLICTSGTSGKLKVAAFKNESLLKKCYSKDQKRDPTTKTTLLLAPVNWISFFFSPIGVAASGGIRLQTSRPDNYDHIIDMINKYKPEIALLSPALIGRLLARQNEVDLTCFKNITVTGSKLYQDIQAGFKKLLASNCMLMEAYGQTESIGPVLAPNVFGPPGSCGRPVDMYTVKLVDPDTGVEIKEPNVTGEVFVKGPGFSCYYNDPEETANSFTEDGFFKTGDLLYRDKDNNYYFVDRCKTLMKYRNHHIYPAELEEVINRHPGVKDVCVVGIEDPVDGQRPVACVVRHGDSDVSAQEIKDLITRNLSKNKELRGGVLFLDSLPYTSTGKIQRNKVKEIAINAKRE